MIKSLHPQNNRNIIFKTSEKITEGDASNEGGRSSSFFFFTQDRKYMVKTLTRKEFRVLKELLPEIERQINSKHGDLIPSMLSQIHGMFQVSINSQSKVYFLLQKNCSIQKFSDSVMSHRFDLKGSMINRRSFTRNNLKPRELRKFCENQTLKDQDLVYLLNSKTPNLIKISLESKRMIMRSIKRDAELLCDQGIMDYSLLLSIEDT